MESFKGIKNDFVGGIRMLFEEHKEKLLNSKQEVLYYAGGTIVMPSVMPSVICLVTGVKQVDGQIRTNVTYHRPDSMPEQKQNKVYSQADFEKFLFEINNRMVAAYGDEAKLKEIRYRTRTFDSNMTAHLDDEELEFLHYKYLLEMVTGSSRTEAYEHITELFKNKIKERI